MRSALVLFVLLTLPLTVALRAHARHVSYLGGTSLMSTNRSDWSELMVSHTLWPRIAPMFDYRVYRELGDKHHFVFAGANALGLRWNEDAAQTNFYASLGAGLETSGSIEAREALLLAMDADRETRRFYSEARYEALGVWRSQPFTLARLRVGLAPYLAEMESLHSFVLLQAEYESRTGLLDWTPMIRLSYSSLLLELGYSQNGIWHFNWSTEF